MNSHDLPVLPEFAVVDPDAVPGTPDQPQVEMPHVHCAAGWVVEMQNMVESVPSPAVVGAAVFTAQQCLHAAVDEVYGRYNQLLAGGFFDVDGDHVEVQIVPQPLGEVTDPDGNPVDPPTGAS